MLNVNIIRQSADFVKERLAIKNFSDIHLVDEIILLDEETRKLKSETENLQAQMNVASKKIGALMAQGNKEEAETEKNKVSELKQIIQQKNTELTQKEKAVFDKLVLLPNLPNSKVPKGKTAEDNVVVKEGGFKPKLYAGAVPHWDLITQYDIIDFEAGAKITGSGFPLYKGKGAKLQRALVNFFLDENIAAGYKEVLPSVLVNEASAFATGQLPDKEGQMYFIQDDNLFLIPTSEVPTTNLYRDEIIKQEDLPIKLTSFSSCFRREAGSFGKEVRGLNRLHQFEKVEIVQITKPEDSEQAHQEMVNQVEQLLIKLELPYRILCLCGGDMSFASAITYDFEVYSAAQERWLEVSSVSNFETFQTNRLKTRYKDDSGKTQLCHSLNGSALALPRIVAALLENNQTEDGIKIPKALHSYFGAENIKLD